MEARELENPATVFNDYTNTLLMHEKSIINHDVGYKSNIEEDILKDKVFSTDILFTFHHIPPSLEPDIGQSNFSYISYIQATLPGPAIIAMLRCLSSSLKRKYYELEYHYSESNPEMIIAVTCRYRLSGGYYNHSAHYGRIIHIVLETIEGFLRHGFSYNRILWNNQFGGTLYNPKDYIDVNRLTYPFIKWEHFEVDNVDYYVDVRHGEFSDCGNEGNALDALEWAYAGITIDDDGLGIIVEEKWTIIPSQDVYPNCPTFEFRMGYFWDENARRKIYGISNYVKKEGN